MNFSGRQRGAFTLLEVMLVITIIGVIAAFAWPDFQAASQSEQLTESARRMQAVLAMCRAEAMNTARRHRIEFEIDGTIRIERQLDPMWAPHIYDRVREGWAMVQILSDDVWVSDLEVLAEGPPPIQIIDDNLELPDTEIDPLPIEEYDLAVAVDIEPDGSCPSVRWVLRDETGRGLLCTLDGRLGRMVFESWERLSEDDVLRPEPVEAKQYDDYEVEDFKRR